MHNIPPTRNSVATSGNSGKEYQTTTPTQANIPPTVVSNRLVFLVCFITTPDELRNYSEDVRHFNDNEFIITKFNLMTSVTLEIGCLPFVKFARYQ
jgi:hypothetical protein